MSSRTIIVKNSYSSIFEQLQLQYNELDSDGSFFAIVSTVYDLSGNVVNDFMDVITEGLRIGYQYINTIVYPGKKIDTGCFIDNTKYIVWLCKDKSNVCFNKDIIREKHIWKDVEWGKRAKNYNPKGKDPGNVWIPTIDNGKAVITKHILLTEEEITARLINMTNSVDSHKIIESKADLGHIPSKIESSTFESEPASLTGKIIFNTSENMKEVISETVKVVVTSPPYWNLKDYFKEGQIGQESYDVYLSRMKKVWKECYRILTNDGCLWININIRCTNGNTILIPKDFVNICKDLGFYYKGIVIWHKSSGIPTNAHNIVDRHEYVLLFTKSEEFSVNYSKYMSFSDYKNDDINGGSFWNINRKAGSVGKKYIHPAIYPNGLVERIVLSSSNPYEYVLDPFLGSGTSLIAAVNVGRNFIGYEYNEGFLDLISDRMKNEITIDNLNVVFSVLSMFNVEKPLRLAFKNKSKSKQTKLF